jgi:four helix bundle suffix protein
MAHPGESESTGRDAPEPIIPTHGGYRKLKSFQVAQLAYDVTIRFCGRYIDRRSRTHDQMVQAARSGVQNIAEGSLASGTSKKTELKLTNVARASLEELRLDYEDYLRHHRLRQWEPGDSRGKALVARRCAAADEVAAWVREVHQRERGRGRTGRDGPDGPGPRALAQSAGHQASVERLALSAGRQAGVEGSNSSSRSTYPGLAANAALVLIGVAVSLLDRQIASLAKSFENEGGFTERLYRVRQARRRGR